jgi:hypothetical protein
MVAVMHLRIACCLLLCLLGLEVHLSDAYALRIRYTGSHTTAAMHASSSMSAVRTSVPTVSSSAMFAQRGATSSAGGKSNTSTTSKDKKPVLVDDSELPSESTEAIGLNTVWSAVNDSPQFWKGVVLAVTILWATNFALDFVLHCIALSHALWQLNRVLHCIALCIEVHTALLYISNCAFSCAVHCAGIAHCIALRCISFSIALRFAFRTPFCVRFHFLLRSALHCALLCITLRFSFIFSAHYLRIPLSIALRFALHCSLHFAALRIRFAFGLHCDLNCNPICTSFRFALR